jgi:hypothetical protein
MKEFLFETIADYFHDGLMTVTKGDFVTAPVTGATLRRDEELNLILELKSRERREKPERYPAGTVRSADEVIEFRHLGGCTGIARGVVERGMRSHSNSAGDGETIDIYSAQSFEINMQREAQPAYTIEWVLNLPDGFAWTEPVRFSGVETLTKTVGSGDDEIRMTKSFELGGGNKSLHLRISEIDLYVMRSSDRNDDEGKAGQIVYRGCPDQAFRDKVRTCLSFILGKPIVYLGHTDYCIEWTPTFMRSVDAFSIDGAVFKLHDLPPYPINQPRYANMIDQKHVGILVNALLEKYESIKFNELSWAYWYAVCAPLHAAAIHFGSLIEQLQKNSNSVIEVRKSLLENDTWKGLNGVIQQWMKTATIDPELRKILGGKVSSLNQAPQSLVFGRLLETMGLATSDVEMKAWKHRNRAAHGGISDQPIEIILNSKILRLLFHRMLAGITYCSDRYIDYYNLDHPVRAVIEAVPSR